MTESYGLFPIDQTDTTNDIYNPDVSDPSYTQPPGYTICPNDPSQDPNYPDPDLTDTGPVDPNPDSNFIDPVYPEPTYTGPDSTPPAIVQYQFDASNVETATGRPASFEYTGVAFPNQEPNYTEDATDSDRTITFGWEGRYQQGVDSGGKTVIQSGTGPPTQQATNKPVSPNDVTWP
ncbi:hypothetical protein ACM01_03860 [Streptomyces viridochromogenes]|uniref:Uncharacterized protein n=1 Tax=Streptomyces viridochromogenes TaxID=1938 RepID=A0A0J7ZPA5_STRVR|nr:hypothetical protein [Streptomyces viridochromogenes]KMS76958.1 hypothetical protein ACM01_03860 [Streptomyces viridochromogenes]